MPAKKTVFNLDDIVDDFEPFEFTFGEEQFQMSGTPDIKFFELIRAGDFQQALWLALGKDQYELMDGLPTAMTLKRAKALFEAYGEHIGSSDMGKSSASSSSAKTVRKASRR